jgi:hypothetical protein
MDYLLIFKIIKSGILHKYQLLAMMARSWSPERMDLFSSYFPYVV